MVLSAFPHGPLLWLHFFRPSACATASTTCIFFAMESVSVKCASGNAKWRAECPENRRLCRYPAPCRPAEMDALSRWPVNAVHMVYGKVIHILSGNHINACIPGGIQFIQFVQLLQLLWGEFRKIAFQYIHAAKVIK